MANVIALPTRPERIKLDCAPELYAPVLIPPGDYELAYVGHRAARQFRRGVLTVWFVVVDTLPEKIVVARYYQISVKTQREANGRKRTKWRAPKNGALVSDFRQVFTKPLGRLDRFPIHWLENQHIIGEIGTVTTNYRQAELDQAAYSVVRRLITAC
jgi:hypothetical protein